MKAIYTLVENEIEKTGYTYDEETLNMLEERWGEHQKNPIVYTVSESMEIIANELKEQKYKI